MCLKKKSDFQYYNPLGCQRRAIGSAVTEVSKDSSDCIFRGKPPTVLCNIPEVFKQHRYENLKSRKRFLRHGI